jgi:hypothetical protein
MGNYLIERKKKFDVYVTQEEWDVIAEMAEKEGLTYSEYIRVAVMADAVLSGNQKALKVTFKNASKKAKIFISRKVSLITGKLLGPKLEGLK